MQSWVLRWAAFLSFSNTGGQGCWFHRVIPTPWHRRFVAYLAICKNLLVGVKLHEPIWTGCPVSEWQEKLWTCTPLSFEKGPGREELGQYVG